MLANVTKDVSYIMLNLEGMVCVGYVILWVTFIWQVCCYVVPYDMVGCHCCRFMMWLPQLYTCESWLDLT